jgi:hypothetical protein
MGSSARPVTGRDVLNEPGQFGLAASDILAHLPNWIFDAVWEDYSYAPGPGGICALGALGAALGFPFTVESNAHFIVCKMTMLVTDQTVPNPVPVPLPLVLCNIQQSGVSTRGFQPGGINLPLTNLFGTGQLPRVLNAAKLVPANSQVIVNLTNLSTVALNVFLTFSGFAVVISG